MIQEKNLKQKSRDIVPFRIVFAVQNTSMDKHIFLHKPVPVDALECVDKHEVVLEVRVLTGRSSVFFVFLQLFHSLY
jgi:hypothetical protein